MKPNNQNDPKDDVANLSKRARLDALLFNGAKPAALISALGDPKIPIGLGE